MAYGFMAPGYKKKSTTKEAKQIIRNEIKSYFSPSYKGEGRSALDNMKKQADSEKRSDFYKNRFELSDYACAARLVDSGFFGCYYSQQTPMLSKIYGKKNVENWSGDKIHSTYRHLIAREYDAMLREKEKNKK